MFFLDISLYSTLVGVGIFESSYLIHNQFGLIFNN